MVTAACLTALISGVPALIREEIMRKKIGSFIFSRNCSNKEVCSINRCSVKRFPLYKVLCLKPEPEQNMLSFTFA